MEIEGSDFRKELLDRIEKTKNSILSQAQEWGAKVKIKCFFNNIDTFLMNKISFSNRLGLC
jgi:hypothetical protein